MSLQYEHAEMGALMPHKQFKSQEEWENENRIWDLCSCFVIPDRKKRLFGAACCRHLLYHIPQSFHHGIETAEKFADGLVTEFERKRVFQQLSQLSLEQEREGRRRTPCHVVCASLYFSPNMASMADYCASIVNNLNMFHREREWQLALLRSMIKPFTSPPNYHYNSTIKQLAQAVYNRDLEAVNPLHDALLEQGYNDLAEEYKSTEFIYKGHWATDVILGK